MKIEFDNIQRDLHSAVVDHGEVSERQRYPETADAIASKLGAMDDLISRSKDTIKELSG